MAEPAGKMQTDSFYSRRMEFPNKLQGQYYDLERICWDPMMLEAIKATSALGNDVGMVST